MWIVSRRISFSSLQRAEKQEVVANCDHLAANTANLKRLAEIDKTLLEQDRSLGNIWQQIQPVLRHWFSQRRGTMNSKQKTEVIAISPMLG
jgi:hypothetical protein